MIVINFSTLKQREKIHKKLKLKVHNGRRFHGSHSTKMAKKDLKASFLESLMKEYK